MQVQKISNNNTTFGIKADKKQCKKVLGKLEPEMKKTLDTAINQFCNITQQSGVKGTFYPVSIRNTDGNMILKYKIIDLHNNGGNNIFKYKQTAPLNSNPQRNNLTIENETILWKHSAPDRKSYLDGFLSKVRNALS